MQKRMWWTMTHAWNNELFDKQLHSQCSVAFTQILWMYCTSSCYEMSHRLFYCRKLCHSCYQYMISFSPCYRFPSKQLLWRLISSCSLFHGISCSLPSLYDTYKPWPISILLSCVRLQGVIDGNVLCLLLCVWEHRITWTRMSERQVFPGQAPLHAASSWTGSLIYLMEAGAIRLFQ